MDVYTPNFDVTLAHLKLEIAKPDISEEGRQHWKDIMAMIEDPSLNPYGEFHQLSEDGSNVQSIIFVVLHLVPGYEYSDEFLEANGLLLRMESEDDSQTMDIFFSEASITRDAAAEQVRPVIAKLAQDGFFVGN